ncbi:ABC transporter permease [Glycomyces algeriensis]|uniref:Transport permease protein n=1 Tax=Glycomyces algeriensis TaxID=256037 RepID=A0A9W6GCV9_9ACTN|nr:ABC transporter permease [Glycomyces algeriensis]MDA1368676.1 ABC transporter permease [Glycomyces algeriensis]MDR7351713.1 ABC-2 type transport system permease protein [Glycomyces algeriensis]GLI44439.1 transport permease protein [Glycomyces algeriensis]
MSLRITFITAGRILRQLLNDRRTMVLILAMPSLLIALISAIMDSSPQVFNSVGLILLAFFPFMMMFMITSITLLRERTGGTLERLMTTPTRKLDLVGGYAIAFGVAAASQTAIAATVAYAFLGLETAGPAWAVFLIAIAASLFGMALGLFVSAFATTEFQAIQFMPVFVVPQLLLCGLIWPRDQMAGWLQGVSDVLPVTYAVKALTEVQVNTETTAAMWGDLSIVAAAVLVATALGAATLRRRTN